jgi:hypothetical protein
MTHSLPAPAGWLAVSARMEGSAFIVVNQRNRQPTQGCFSDD